MLRHALSLGLFLSLIWLFYRVYRALLLKLLACIPQVRPSFFDLRKHLLLLQSEKQAHVRMSGLSHLVRACVRECILCVLVCVSVHARTHISTHTRADLSNSSLCVSVVASARLETYVSLPAALYKWGDTGLEDALCVVCVFVAGSNGQRYALSARFCPQTLPNM